MGRELTPNEVYRLELSTLIGPVGLWLGNRYFPDAPGGNPPPHNPQAHSRNINIPPPDETHFVPNEVLVEFDSGASARYRDALARSLQLTLLDTQSFALTGRSLQRWRIDGTRSVPATLRALERYGRIALAQANFSYLGQQGAPAATREASGDGAAQYVSPSCISRKRTRSPMATTCWSRYSIHRSIPSIPISQASSPINMTCWEDLLSRICMAPAWPAQSRRMPSLSASRPR
jgi:hypothetical protein